MKISLIIPAYNEEKSIGACLDSAIENGKGFISEIIVVDNASSDMTSLIAEKKPGVKVIKEDKKGVMHARQRGYTEASGDILLFVDADNLMPKKWIEKVVKQFENDKNVVCVSGPYHYYDVSAFKNYLVKMYWYLIALPTYWIVGYMAVFGNLAIRKDTVDKMNGFDTSIEFYGDDTNTARRASKFGKVKFIPNIVMYSSGRRLEKQGMLDAFKKYGLNFLFEVVLHKPLDKKYKDFR